MKNFSFFLLPLLAIVVPFQVRAAQPIKESSLQNLKHLELNTPLSLAFLTSQNSNLEPKIPDRIEQLSVQLVQEVKQIDPAIIDVRAGVTISSAPEEYVSWNPVIVLQKGTSESKQKEIALKLADYVVQFHYKHEGKITMGSDSLGGIFAFFEGQDWKLMIGDVAYRVIKRKPLLLDVYLSVRSRKADGSLSDSCCELGDKIGTVENGKFNPLTSK